MTITKANMADQLAEAYVEPEWLAKRWHTTVETLANQRYAGRGIPFFKTPGGSILYAMSDVLEAELNGKRGISAAQVEEAILSTPGCDLRVLRAVAKHVRALIK
ncbi:hypothetical protein [Hyphomicrobium sp. DY-1]|uniref:hypothetical protein n=1 Tax=Hyphomicrobium sp. DY-1 TaxID=3075650 RepID=UPI0039C1E0B8